MDSVEISLHIPLKNPLKMPERSKLVSALVESLRKSGIQDVVVRQIGFLDRRSPVDVVEGALYLVVDFDVAGVAVQIIEALEALIEDGRSSPGKLLIKIAGEFVVDEEGNLLADEKITGLIWSSKKLLSVEGKGEAPALALVFGSIVYSAWSSQPMPVIITTTKREIIHNVMNGRTRGLAPWIRIKWFSCSICNENIEACEHVVGEKYGDVCIAIPRDIQVLQESITEAVVDPRCKVTDLLVMEQDRGNCTWYGFQGVDVLVRLKNINDSLKDKIIPKEAASKFRAYFSKRSAGRCRYDGIEQKSRTQVASRRKETGA